MALITAFTCGSGRARTALPPAVASRLEGRGRVDPRAMQARLAHKAAAASSAKAELDLAAARRAAAALQRRERARSALALRQLALASATAHKLERAAEQKQRVITRKQFPGKDAGAKIKHARHLRRARQEERGLRLAASLLHAERRHAAHLEERRAKAHAVTERHAAVVRSVRATESAKKLALASKMRDRDDYATASRLTQYGMTMSRNIAHTLHVLHIHEAKESYDCALQRYGKARLQAKEHRAELLRELHIDEVRAKAHKVADGAKEKALVAKCQLEASLRLTSQTTCEKLARAATRMRLMRQGELKEGEKLSICSEFIVSAAGAWRPVPPPAGWPAADSDSDWEELQSPVGKVVTFA